MKNNKTKQKGFRMIREMLCFCSHVTGQKITPHLSRGRAANGGWAQGATVLSGLEGIPFQDWTGLEMARSVVDCGEATYSVPDRVSWRNKTLCYPLVNLHNPFSFI